MQALTLLRIDGSRDKKMLSELRAEDDRMPTTESVRAELLPLLPEGTNWPEGSGWAEWKSADNRLELRFNPETGAGSIRALAFRGALLDSLRRIHSTDRWVLVSLANAEIFDFDNPDDN